LGTGQGVPWQRLALGCFQGFHYGCEEFIAGWFPIEVGFPPPLLSQVEREGVPVIAADGVGSECFGGVICTGRDLAMIGHDGMSLSVVIDSCRQ
jgi:hypothetical protein